MASAIRVSCKKALFLCILFNCFVVVFLLVLIHGWDLVLYVAGLSVSSDPRPFSGSRALILIMILILILEPLSLL